MFDIKLTQFQIHMHRNVNYYILVQLDTIKQ